MNDEAIDLGSIIAELCDKVGLDKKNVSRIELLPNQATFDVFARNADGAKFVDDFDTNHVATEPSVVVKITS